MKPGDLVKINDLNEPDPRRMIGTIIKHEMYDAQFSKMGEKITEVLWNGGHLGWILTTRLDLIDVIDKKRNTAS